MCAAKAGMEFCWEIQRATKDDRGGGGNRSCVSSSRLLGDQIRFSSLVTNLFASSPYFGVAITVSHTFRFCLLLRFAGQTGMADLNI